MTTLLHGFSMALADSVPGVSGGTIAFILGFYERLLGAIDTIFHKCGPRRPAMRYLARFFLGWAAGLMLSLLLIAQLLEQHIYLLSSVFLGLTAASIPSILRSERRILRENRRECVWLLVGAAAVVALSALRRSPLISTSLRFSALRAADCVYVFFTGSLAVGATVLPGISGSSVLMIFGVYVPALRAVRQFFALDFSVLPGLVLLALGMVLGAAVFVRLIRRAMQHQRPRMIWAILGLMCGSLYAICLGPTTLESPLPPLAADTFRPLGFLLGIAILLLLEAFRRMSTHQTAQK